MDVGVIYWKRCQTEFILQEGILRRPIILGRQGIGFFRLIQRSSLRMEQYCVYLVPKIKCSLEIQTLRLKYDPLAQMIPLHLTVVFPFRFESIETLIGHLDMYLRIARPIGFSLGEPETNQDYAWLPIVDGAPEIRSLHAQLYSGTLKKFLSNQHPFHPHLTFGRFKERSEGLKMKREAISFSLIRGIFDEAILESIDKNENGHVRGTWSLK